MIVTGSARFAAVIPARGGSKGIPRKNLREVAGKPLLAWSIEAVASAAAPMRVLVSTDDGGADVDAVVMLQPTSPLRLPGSLDAAIELFESSGADTLVSVVETAPFLWSGSVDEPVPGYDIDRRPRRQDLPDEQRRYRENGSIYVSSVEMLRSRRNRLGGKITMFIMDPREGVDVDEEVDLRIVSELLEERR